MSENNSEKIKISHRSFDIEETRKQSPLLFVVENDDDDKKKLYLLSPEDQFSEPDSHAFYKFPCLLKVGDNLFELHITAGAINISIPRDQEKKLLRDLKTSIRSSLSKRNNDSSDFRNNIKKFPSGDGSRGFIQKFLMTFQPRGYFLSNLSSQTR